MTRTIRRALETTLLAVGLACIGGYIYLVADQHLHQATYSRQLDELIAARTKETADHLNRRAAATLPAVPSSAFRLEGDLVGRVEIPRIGVSAAVVYGDSQALLNVAVGQLPGTPRPGRRGNAVLAGHRDTFFRNLRGIRVGDQVRLELPDTDYVYDVTKILVVKPEDVFVLNDTPGGTLTLITCYPFYYVGPAPFRFVVQAALRPE